MKNQLIAYLKRNKITEPCQVDRLLVSAFVAINKIKIKNNKFILQYLIKPSISNEDNLLSELLKIITTEFQNFGFEELIKLFEFVISPSDRIVNGAVYTPPHIREYITKAALEHSALYKNLTIADISCGCGGFLFTACIVLKKLTNYTYYTIFKKNLYGVDIQKYSVDRTKILLTLLAIYNKEDREEFIFNIHVGDSLSFNWKEHINSFRGFDVVIGNPPYVCSRNLSVETKQLLDKWSVCSSGHPDLYIPFFQIGLEHLSKDGILGYITMNTFFKSLNGRALRQYFHTNDVHLKIINFGSEQIFNSKNTYTCLCFLEKINAGYIEYSQINSSLLNSCNVNFEKIDYNSLNHHKGWNLYKNSIMQQIESIGKPFGKIYKTRHGIATLKNNIYIFRPTKQDSSYYYIELNETVYKIEKNICRDVINSNKLSSNYSLDDLTEKLIFPYIDTDKKPPQIIPEDKLKKQYPYTYEYLLSNRKTLDSRDKGNKEYPSWYAYGRTQSLQRIKNKLFIPKISNSSPYSIISTDENLMFYNGMAIVGHSFSELLFIQKIISSRLFWYYISNTSKPYASNYFSLNGNYINNFGIYQFTDDEIKYILSERDKEKLDNFIEKKYDITIPE